MPRILMCRFPRCRDTTPLDEFEHDIKKWYCKDHRWASEMTDQEIIDHLARREKTHSAQSLKERLVIALTDEQMTELREILRKHHSEPTVLTRVPDEKPVADMNEAELREHIELREEFHETDKQYKDLDIKKFHGMADIGLGTLLRIYHDPENETGDMADADRHAWVERVSKRAIDEMRKLRDV